MPRVSNGCCSCAFFLYLLTSASGYYTRYSGQDVAGGRILRVTPTGHFIQRRPKPAAAPDVEPIKAEPVQPWAAEHRGTLDQLKSKVESSLMSVQGGLQRTDKKQSNREMSTQNGLNRTVKKRSLRQRRIRKIQRQRRERRMRNPESWVQTDSDQRKEMRRSVLSPEPVVHSQSTDANRIAEMKAQQKALRKQQQKEEEAKKKAEAEKQKTADSKVQSDNAPASDNTDAQKTGDGKEGTTDTNGGQESTDAQSTGDGKQGTTGAKQGGDAETNAGVVEHGANFFPGASLKKKSGTEQKSDGNQVESKTGATKGQDGTTGQGLPGEEEAKANQLTEADEKAAAAAAEQKLEGADAKHKKAEEALKEQQEGVWNMTYMEKLELEIGWIFGFVNLAVSIALLAAFWPYRAIGRKYQDIDYTKGRDESEYSGLTLFLYGSFWGQNGFSYVINFLIIAVSLWNFTMFCLQTEATYFSEEVTWGIHWASFVSEWSYWTQFISVIFFSVVILLRTIGANAHPFWENYGASASLMFLVGDVYTHVEIIALIPTILDFLSGEDYFMNLTWISIIRTAEMMSRQQSTGHVINRLEEVWEHQALISLVFTLGLITWIAMSGMYFVVNRNNEDAEWEAAAYEGKTWQRFNSIPSSMWFVLLNLSCEDPLADVHTTGLQRFCVTLTCMIGVPFFSLPTGIFGGIITNSATSARDQLEDRESNGNGENSENAENSESNEEQVEKAHEKELQKVHWIVPFVIAFFSLISVWTYFFWTASRTPQGKTQPFQFLWIQWEIKDATLAYVDGAVSVIFFLEWMYWILVDGCEGYLCSAMCLIDLLSWVPGAIHIAVFLTLKLSLDEEVYMDWLRLLCVIRLMKTERFVGAFREMAGILYEDKAILKGTYYMAFMLLLLFSTIFFYTERQNPDDEMQEYFGSSARTVWAMLINLHGEWVWADYTPWGKAFGTILDFTAIGICMIPICIFSEAYQDRLDAQEGETSLAMKPWQAKCRPDDDRGEAAQLKIYDAFYYHLHVPEKFLPIGFKILRSISVFFIILSTVSTVVLSLNRFEEAAMKKEADAMLDTLSMLFYCADIVCASWFTLEFFLRMVALGGFHAISFVGLCDLASLAALWVSILPWMHNTCLHPKYESEWIIDDAVVPLRLLRLFVLESYVPVMHALSNVFWINRINLLRSLWALLVVWYIFGSLLYMCERELPGVQPEAPKDPGMKPHLAGKHAQDVEEEEEGDMEMKERYKDILSGLQYALVHMTGDYPIVEYIIQSKIVHFFGCQLGMIVVAAFNGILTAGFQNYLEDQRGLERKAEAKKRLDTAISCVYVLQYRFRRIRKQRLALLSGAATQGHLHGPSEQNHPFRFIRELTHRSRPSGVIFMGICNFALILNVLNTMLSSIDEVEDKIGFILDPIEMVTTIVFAVEYFFRLLAYPRPFQNIIFPMRILDLLCLLPGLGFIIHWTYELRYRSKENEEFWESLLEFARVLRVIRLLDLPYFKRELRKTQKTLGDIMQVLALPSLLGLQVWVFSASIFVLVENLFQGPEAENMDTVASAMYWTSIFIIGEWANVDFSPGAGSRVCIFYCLLGICFFAIPVGLCIESVQHTLETIQEERREVARLYKIGKEGAPDSGFQGTSWGPASYNQQPGYYDMGSVMGPGYRQLPGPPPGAEYGMPFGPPGGKGGPPMGPGPEYGMPFGPGPPGPPASGPLPFSSYSPFDGPPMQPPGPPGSASFAGGAQSFDGPPMQPPGPPGSASFAGGARSFNGPPMQPTGEQPGSASFGGPQHSLDGYHMQPTGPPGGPPLGPGPYDGVPPSPGPPMQPPAPHGGPAAFAGHPMQAQGGAQSMPMPLVHEGPPKIVRPPAPQPVFLPRPPGPLSGGPSSASAPLEPLAGSSGQPPLINQPPAYTEPHSVSQPQSFNQLTPMNANDPTPVQSNAGNQGFMTSDPVGDPYARQQPPYAVQHGSHPSASDTFGAPHAVQQGTYGPPPGAQGMPPGPHGMPHGPHGMPPGPHGMPPGPHNMPPGPPGSQHQYPPPGYY